jgi:hypothetical protein
VPSFFIPTLSSSPSGVKVEEGQWLAHAKPAQRNPLALEKSWSP